jgi:hypothetical protein
MCSPTKSILGFGDGKETESPLLIDVLKHFSADSTMVKNEHR